MRNGRSTTAFLFTRVVLMLAIVFAVSTPIFLLVARSTAVIYIAARLIRYACVVFFAIKLRRKYTCLFDDKNNLRKYVFGCAAMLIVISAVLFCSGITGKFVASLGISLGFYGASDAWYRIVLWEQLFNGDLYFSFITSIAILYFTKRPSLESQAADKIV